jgi:hypothetical protein
MGGEMAEKRENGNAFLYKGTDTLFPCYMIDASQSFYRPAARADNNKAQPSLRDFQKL